MEFRLNLETFLLMVLSDNKDGVTRKELIDICNDSNYKINYDGAVLRKAISNLRKEEFPIVSIENKYILKYNIEDINKQIKTYMDRITTYKIKIKKLENVKKKIKGDKKYV